MELKDNKELIEKVNINDLINKIEKDPLPTNIFTTEDTDPLVLLGKLNEVIAHLKALRVLIGESDSKATEALTKAIESLTTAQQAITTATTLGNEAKTIAQNALEQANSAHDTAGEALIEATDALTKAEQAITTATTLGNEAKTDAQQAISTATTLGNEAKAQAQQAITTANEALTQVVQGLGTKVYDNHGNLLTGAKFTGHNGINVDMDETDPETFNIRLDNELVGQLEMLDGLIETIENEINSSIKPRLTSVESTASANASDLEGVHTTLNSHDFMLEHLSLQKANANDITQEMDIKSITAETGNFENINNSLSNINEAINARFSTCIKIGSRVGAGTTNLNRSITDFKIILITSNSNDEGTGEYKSILFIPVAMIRLRGIWQVYSAQGTDNTGYHLRFTSNTAIQVTSEYYAREVAIWGVN